MEKLLIICALPFLISYCYGQDNWNTEIENHFLIVASTKDYSKAVESAQSIAKELDLEFTNNDEYANKTHGLTYSKADCEGDGWDYPCYIPRGGMDDGSYVSIEWSSMYGEFTEGYYIVVVGSSPDREDMKKLLKSAQQFVPRAYIKTALVWFGCLH